MYVKTSINALFKTSTLLNRDFNNLADKDFKDVIFT